MKRSGDKQSNATFTSSAFSIIVTTYERLSFICICSRCVMNSCCWWAGKFWTSSILKDTFHVLQMGSVGGNRCVFLFRVLLSGSQLAAKLMTNIKQPLKIEETTTKRTKSVRLVMDRIWRSLNETHLYWSAIRTTIDDHPRFHFASTLTDTNSKRSIKYTFVFKQTIPNFI